MKEELIIEAKDLRERDEIIISPKLSIIVRRVELKNTITGSFMSIISNPVINGKVFIKDKNEYFGLNTLLSIIRTEIKAKIIGHTTKGNSIYQTNNQQEAIKEDARGQITLSPAVSMTSKGTKKFEEELLDIKEKQIYPKILYENKEETKQVKSIIDFMNLRFKKVAKAKNNQLFFAHFSEQLEKWEILVVDYFVYIDKEVFGKLKEVFRKKYPKLEHFYSCAHPVTIVGIKRESKIFVE